MDEESLEKDRQKSRYEEEKREMVKLLQGVVESNIGVGILSVFLISTSMLMWHTRGTYLPIFFVARTHFNFWHYDRRRTGRIRLFVL